MKIKEINNKYFYRYQESLFIPWKILKKGITLVLIILVMASSADAENRIFTDLHGRKISVKIPVKRIVALRASLGLVCYMELAEQVVGVERLEVCPSEWVGSVGRSYRLANPRLASLPVIGNRNRPDPEKLIQAGPDVILMGNGDSRLADNLQQKTGIPVLFVDNGDLSRQRERFYNSLRLIGSICHRQSRADLIISRINGAIADLKQRTSGIADNDRPKTYISGMNFRVAHGLMGTSAAYPPFMLLGANNIADHLTRKSKMVKGRFELDQERLLAADPDIIFICASGLEMVRQDLQNPAFHQLKALDKGNIFTIVPHYYAASPDTVLAETYYMGTVLYPERFADIKISDTADEWYRFFVSTHLYGEMERIFGGFKQFKLKR
ncbi:MAG: ABC transporter substrate-binding protein [Desulfobacterium sp.]